MAVAGKKVLDIACGTGVGTDYLRKAGAVSCYGIDIDPEAVEFAKANYPGCSFVQGDALRVNLPDSSVDVLVSFETIEHVGEQRKFISECKRVLGPDGLLICSTPNTTLYRWRGTNPYHVHELTPGEFVDLLSEHFCGVALFSQAEWNYPIYLLWRLAAPTLEKLRLRELVKKIFGIKSAPAVLRDEFSGKEGDIPGGIRPYQRSWFTRPMYLIAVARNIKVLSNERG